MKYKTFEEIIEASNVPLTHEPFQLNSGIVELPASLKENFKILFRPSGVKKNVGNGEVAMYWLLSNQYGGFYDIEKQKQNDVADLLVNKVPHEIKAWDQDMLSGVRMKIGKFGKFHEIRRVINIVFDGYAGTGYLYYVNPRYIRCRRRLC